MSTRDDLVLACAELIAAEGAAAFSLRKLAERVGIKAPSIYGHFSSKEALLAEASRHAAGTLAEFLRREDPGQGQDARARLLATAMGYLGFAQARPALFSLLFMELPSQRRSLDAPPDAQSPYAFLLARVSDFLGGERGPAELLSFGIWSLVHGAAVLRHTHLRDFSGPLVEGTHANLARLLDGWQAGNPAPRAPARARARALKKGAPS